MKSLFLYFISTLILLGSYAQKGHGLLKVTPDGHFIEYEDGKPFFWLGDTGWELFHRLTLPEIENYLNNRQLKGFNVIQAVILAELEGYACLTGMVNCLC